MKKISLAVFYLIILTASLLTLLPYLVDGQNGCIGSKCGFVFGTNFRDGIWFMAVANVSFQKFPFLHPTYADEILKGYHFLPNLLVFFLSKIGISSFFSYFKLIPILYFSAITVLLYKIFKKIKDDFVFINLGLFFFYFGIPFTLLTSLLNRQPLNNGLLINTFQATRILESPHTAFGLILFFLILYFFKTNQWQKNWSLILLLYFLSFGIKFYVASAIGLFLGFYFLLYFRKKLNELLKKLIFLLFLSITGVVIFLQPDFSKTSTFNFAPFATVHHLIESQNLFYNHNLVLARYYLYEKGFGPRLLAIEIYSLILFIVFYSGTRIIGFLYLIYKIIKKQISLFDLTIFLTSLILILLSTFFVQRGDWFNPIQFLVPITYVFSFYTALFFFKLYKKNKFISFIIFLPAFIFTFIPNLINLSYPNLPARFIIDKEEIKALNFLRHQSFGSVFSPIDKNDTAYVAAFSNKPTYLNFLTISQTLGINYQKRFIETEKPENFDPNKIKVKYFYLPKDNQYVQEVINKFNKNQFKRIFENQRVIIFSRSSDF